jgi:hypothetical protein
MARKSSRHISEEVALPPRQQDGSETAEDDLEEVHEDDLCAICHLLLYKPVTTRCNHTLCESCMAHWADVSVTSQMTTVGLNDEPMVRLPSDIETRCPMCRTSTTASLDQSRELELQGRYPAMYKVRKVEQRMENEDASGASVEALILYIGNTHRLTRVEDPESIAKHDWKFFVRPSRTDMIEEVQIFLVSGIHIINSVHCVSFLYSLYLYSLAETEWKVMCRVFSILPQGISIMRIELDLLNLVRYSEGSSKATA